MALKLKESEKPTTPATEASGTTALAQLGLGASPLAATTNGNLRSYLPYAKIAYAIETDLKYKVTNPDGSSYDKPAANQLILMNAGDVTKIPVPYLMTVIVGRGATRELLPPKDGGQSYKRTYASLDVKNPNKEHEEQLGRVQRGDPNVLPGTSYLVAFFNDAVKADGCTLALLETFKVMDGYWFKPTRAGLFHNHDAEGKLLRRPDGLPVSYGIKVNLDDHSCNLTTSKSNATKKYLDPRKFKQYEQVVLTVAQQQVVTESLASNKDSVDAWLKRN